MQSSGEELENKNVEKQSDPLVSTVPPPHPPASNTSSLREKRNWQIHKLYIRSSFSECLQLIDQQVKACNGICEYALYIKGLIKRHRGELQESLQLFQAAIYLNPANPNNLKQAGKTLFLMNKFKAALGFFEEAEQQAMEDWEIWHNKGLCYFKLRDYTKAVDAFRRANSISRHDCTYKQLGQLFMQQEDYRSAIDVFLEALEFSPENPEILTNLGLLYLRVGENYRAFDYFGNSLSHDPTNPESILAAGSIIQDHSEIDVALMKYRIAAVSHPNSAQLWNNIGMCFFGKQKYIAAIACLKKALHLAPFEWIIAFNLGLAHLYTKQYASAFHYFSTSVNLKPDFANSYMYLAMTLNKLDDFDNACSAYEKAIQLETDHIFELNYAIMLFERKQYVAAKEHFAAFEALFKNLEEEVRNSDPDVLEKQQILSNFFAGN